MAILTPGPGQLFQDELNISGNVIGGLWDIGRVEIRINGGPWIWATGLRNWFYVLSPNLEDAGEVLIEVRAFDDFTNSTIVSITPLFYVPMTIIIDTPHDGQIVNGSINISGRVLNGYSDIRKVEVRILGKEWVEVVGTHHWYLVFSPSDDDIGLIQIQVRASDDHFSSDIESVNFSYYRPMVIQIIHPQPHDEFTDKINISGTVLNGYGAIQRVELRINHDAWIVIGDARDWQYIIPPVSLRNGENTIEVRAYDENEMSAVEDIIILYSSENANVMEPSAAYIIIIIIGTVILVTILVLRFRPKGS